MTTESARNPHMESEFHMKAKSKIARTKATNKRATEGPLLREIKRIRKPGMPLEDAKRIAEANLARRDIKAKRTETPLPEDAIPNAAARAGIPEAPSAYAARRAAEMREEDLCDLSTLISGGLWVAEEDGIHHEEAMVRVAAATLKAIMLALHASPDNQGPDGWCLAAEDELTTGDLTVALSGVVAMLRFAPKVTRRLRLDGKLRSSMDRKSLERVIAGDEVQS